MNGVMNVKVVAADESGHIQFANRCAKIAQFAGHFHSEVVIHSAEPGVWRQRGNDSQAAEGSGHQPSHLFAASRMKCRATPGKPRRRATKPRGAPGVCSKAGISRSSRPMTAPPP